MTTDKIKELIAAEDSAKNEYEYKRDAHLGAVNRGGTVGEIGSLIDECHSLYAVWRKANEELEDAQRNQQPNRSQEQVKRAE